MLIRLKYVLVMLVIGAAWIATGMPVQTAPWSLRISAASFARSELSIPAHAEAIRRNERLGGGANDHILGWVEYDFTVPENGWYELLVYPGGGDTEFLIDTTAGGSGAYFYKTAGKQGDGEKVGNVWLDTGRHTLRAQRYFWTGMFGITGFEIRASAGVPAKSFRATISDDKTAYKAGHCPNLEVQAGGANRASQLQVIIEDDAGKSAGRTDLRFAASAKPSVRKVPLPCSREGQFLVSFGDASGRHPTDEHRPIQYDVVLTDGVKSGGESSSLIREIDCVATSPDYAGGATRVVATAFGSYRETDDRGFLPWERTPAASRSLLREPSWFAYRLNGLQPQQRYRIEIDYPDDALRTFAVAVRENAPPAYPLSTGADTGGSISLSHKMQTLQMTYWPRAAEPRIVFLNMHDGRRAAAARIRVYKVEGAPALAPRVQGRSFVNWYEEGDNFSGVFGAPGIPRKGQIAVDRWARSLAETGGDIMSPAVAVYTFVLYPSRFMKSFSRPDSDLLQYMMLTAEKYGLKVIPELHPRADELDWAFATSPPPKPNVLVSKDGGTMPFSHSPVHPTNREWYIGAIEELAKRYRTSPAFIGVNLRLMSWSNPTLNNFHSLDWGYDDFTVALFASETGIKVPPGNANDPARFAQRYNWIAANARERWIQWRCDKITDLYRAIRDRLRAVRPDLKLYTSVFRRDRPDTAAEWREAGIDLKRLAALAGVVVVDADQGFGRSEADAAFEQRQHGDLREPSNLGLPPAQARSFLTGANYLEAHGEVVPPEMLGFPASLPRTWTSGVANPAGRNALEPYALQLGKADATLIGVGGNGYTLGNQLLREFLAEYRALPPASFSLKSGPMEPAVVRQLQRKGELLLYAVNITSQPVRVELMLAGASRIESLADRTPLATADGRLVIQLEGFGLKSARAIGNARIVSVSIRPQPQK